MATQVQFRGGTTSQHGSFTGAVREITVDTDKETLVVHDGSTAGGFPLARADGGGVTNFAVGGTLNVTGETTLATHLNLGDNDKIKLGANADLELYHDGSNSYVYEGGTGTLKLATAGASVDIVKGSDSSETMAKFIINDAVELYHDNSKRFETTSAGATVSGNLTADALVVDTMTFNSATATVSGSFTIDSGGDINFDASGTDFNFKVDGTDLVRFDKSGDNTRFECLISDGDLIFRGNDGGTAIEAARFDFSSNGAFCIGQSSSSVSAIGHSFNPASFASHTRASNPPLFLNRTTDGGDIMEVRFGNTRVGSIGFVSTGFYIDGQGNHSGIRFGAAALIPMKSAADSDNGVDLGSSSFRFDDINATNGTIQTSDRNEKQDIAELTDAEKKVAVVAKGLLRKYRWKNAVAEKGDKARTHFGIIAQDLQDAFTAESLDASKYAMFCSNTWWEKEMTIEAVEAKDEVKDSDGNVISEVVHEQPLVKYMDIKEEATTGYSKKTRLGVRYNELLAFIISAI